MFDSLGCCGYLLLAVLIYKALDWFVRLFWIGKYDTRYILVTGCDTGFGNLLVKRLDRLGCHVFAGCLTESGETELKKSCSNNVVTLSLDVTKQERVRNALEFVKEKLPPGKGLWGLVNNAGVLGPTGPADWQTIEDYKDIAAVNLYGLVDVTLTFLPLVKIERGRIVNSSSLAGRFSLAGCVPHNVTKYGVESFTDGLRRTMCPFGVKALIVEPGIYNTNFMNREVMAGQMKKSWEILSPDIKKEYGDEYFQYVNTSKIEVFIKIGSYNFDKVVDAYQHALLGHFPRARYMIGTYAKYVFMPMQWLPEWLGDWANEKLESDSVRPAIAIKKN